jgi:hypothetical protein
MRPDDHIGAEVHAFADFSAGVDDGCGMDARGVLWRLVEEFQRACKRVIRVGQPQGCERESGETRLDQDGARGGCLCQRGVLWVRDKGYLVRAGSLDPGNAGDLCFRDRLG